MRIIEVQQGTPEWIAARCGVPSASSFDMIITTKGVRSKQAEKYMYKLAGERICGIPEETYTNASMERGKIMEAEAREAYSFITGNEVKQVGFCVTEGKFIVGCSPDALVGKDGGYEVKCPSMAVHVGYLLENVLPTDYIQQVQGSLFVTQCKWWDFMSFYPGIKPLIIRVLPDPMLQKAMRIEFEIFCEQLDEITRRIK